MNIIHKTLFKDVSKIINYYSEQDGVPIHYVCTSAIHEQSDQMYDIFYRETYHPYFGNRYFALTTHSLYGVLIAGADQIEDLVFDMIEVDQVLHYSRDRHDFNAVKEGVSIDGGRAYTRTTSPHLIRRLKIKDGEFYEI